MKKAIVILLLGFIAGSGYSQSTLKGIYLGGALSYYQQTNNTSSLCTTGNWSNYKATSTQKSSSIMPEIGYSFSSRAAVGFSIGYDYSKYVNTQNYLDNSGNIIPNDYYKDQTLSHSLNISPFFKLNLKLIDNFSLRFRFIPSVSFGKDDQEISSIYPYSLPNNSSNKEKVFSYAFSIEPGFEYLLKNRFAFALNLGSIGYNYSKTTPTTLIQQQSSDSKSFYSNIGLDGFSLGVVIYLSKGNANKSEL